MTEIYKNKTNIEWQVAAEVAQWADKRRKKPSDVFLRAVDSFTREFILSAELMITTDGVFVKPNWLNGSGKDRYQEIVKGLNPGQISGMQAAGLKIGIGLIEDSLVRGEY